MSTDPFILALAVALALHAGAAVLARRSRHSPRPELPELPELTIADVPGPFRVTGTLRRDGSDWSRVLDAGDAGHARRKAQRLGVDVVTVRRDGW